MDVFDLTAKIKLDSSEFDSGLDSASGKANGFASKLGGGLATAAKVSAAGLMAAAGAGIAVTGAFIKGTSAVAQYGDNIDKMSQKMGMSATAYQEWDAVMQHSGTSMETLKASMKTLASAAETGKDAFDRLGISQEQIASMNQEELFSATITALQNVDSETERTYLAGQLLGRGATELGALLNTSAEDTQAMKDRVHELGGVMSDEGVKAAARFKDSLQDMHAAIDGAKRSLVEGFLPAVSDIMDGIGNVVSGFDVEGGLQQIEQGVDNFINNLNDVIPRVAELAGRIIPAFAKAIASNLPKLAQTGLDLILRLGQGIANAIPNLIAQLPAIIVGIVNFITSNLPAIVQTGVQIILGIIQGLAQALPQLIAAAPQILMAIGQGILGALQILWENGPQIVQAIGEGVLNALGALGELGMHIVRAIGEGILSALGWLGDAIISLFDSGYTAGDAKAGEYRSLGEHAAVEVDEGYRSKSGNFSTTVSGSVDKAKQAADSKVGGFTGSGGSMAGGWIDGWNGVSLSTPVNTTMGNAVKTAHGWAPEFSSPGDASMNYLAYPFLSGGGQLASGVDTAMGGALSAGEAGAVEFGSVGNSMVNETRSNIAAAAPAVSSAARGVVVTAYTVANAATSMFSSVGAQISNGIASGIMSAAGRIAAAAARVVSTALAAARAAAVIESPSKLFRDEVGYYIGLGVAEGIEDSEDEAAKAANDLARDVFEKSQEWLRRQTKFNKLSLQDQIAYWREIQSQFIKESRQWIDAEEEIFDLRENIQDNYRDNVEKIWKNIADIYENYEDKVTDRIEEIAGAYGLFDDVQDRYALNSEELITNLQRQVNVLGDFYTGLDELAAKGATEQMIQEIREMGPKAVDQLDALLAMTEDQFRKYAALYGEKQELANRTALKELEGLKIESAKEIKDQLSELEKLYKENSPELGETFADSIAQGIKDSMGIVATQAANLAKAANQAFYNQIDRVMMGGLSTGSTSFAGSALGGVSAATINTISSTVKSTGGTAQTINLVAPNGETLAKYVFNPLKNYAASKGQAITAAT